MDLRRLQIARAESVCHAVSVRYTRGCCVEETPRLGRFRRSERSSGGGFHFSGREGVQEGGGSQPQGWKDEWREEKEERDRPGGCLLWSRCEGTKRSRRRCCPLEGSRILSGILGREGRRYDGPPPKRLIKHNPRRALRLSGSICLVAS